MVDDDQQAVCDGHGGFLLAEAAGQAAVLGSQVAAPAPSSCQGALDQGRPQVAIALAGLATVPLAGALVVAGTQPGPGGAVPGGREAAQFGTQLSQDDLSRPLAHPGDGVQARQRGRERALPLLNL